MNVIYCERNGPPRPGRPWPAGRRPSMSPIYIYCACAALRANVAGRIGNGVSQAELAFSACIGSGSSQRAMTPQSSSNILRALVRLYATRAIAGQPGTRYP